MWDEVVTHNYYWLMYQQLFVILSVPDDAGKRQSPKR